MRCRLKYDWIPLCFAGSSNVSLDYVLMLIQRVALRNSNATTVVPASAHWRSLPATSFGDRD